MQRLGIIDLGSNTARLVVYAYEAGSWFRLEDEIREPIRLASGFGDGSRLSPGAIKRCVTALKLFQDYALASGLKNINIIATSAVRDADNKNRLLKRLRPLDLPVQILSGEEEAQRGVLAVANGLAVEDAWVTDLGGGSLEISRMGSRRFLFGESFPLGMVRLTERFLKSDPPTREEVKHLEQALKRSLWPYVQRMKKDDAPLVALGGSVRNLARAVQKRNQYPLSLLHGYPLLRTDLAKLTSRLLRRNQEKRQAIPGIRADRADVILASALLFRWLLSRSGRDRLIISGHGLREGTLYHHLLPAPHLKKSVKAFAVEDLLSQFPQPKGHILHTRRLARTLFEGLRPLHKLANRYQEILDAAAALHDVGQVLSYYRHAQHGVYLMGSRPLTGFWHREQALIMQLIRYHEKGNPKLAPFEGLLSPKYLPRLLRLTACLRLAEHLERSRAGRVRDLSIEIGKKNVEICLEVEDKPTLELWEAQKMAAPLFERAFRRRLLLTTKKTKKAPINLLEAVS
ncbi:MAG: Ppx/GppA family phosphatase [Deltaproteobacteria bacterium]|nr:Ppx/GppA family phosphatase [Deltaproteobacteria bacterium]